MYGHQNVCFTDKLGIHVAQNEAAGMPLHEGYAVISHDEIVNIMDYISGR